MNYIAEVEFKDMTELVDSDICNNVKCKRTKFVDFDDWEDEYSHNEIGEAQKEFVEEANKYFKNNSLPYVARVGVYCAFVESV